MSTPATFRRVDPARNRMTMIQRLRRNRDRAGHAAAISLFAAAALLVALIASAAGPGDYKAQRFDVVLTPQRGDLEVSETITFEFQSGTFRKVWRDLPTARTDGIEVTEARMDGAVMPLGEGGGPVGVGRGSRIRVQWNFAPVGPSVHTFALRYRARGVATRDGASDILRWRALPGEPRYTTEASRITVVADQASVRDTGVERVASISSAASSEGRTFDLMDVRPNG